MQIFLKWVACGLFRCIMERGEEEDESGLDDASCDTSGIGSDDSGCSGAAGGQAKPKKKPKEKQPKEKQPEAKKLKEKEPKKKQPREKAEEKKHKETEAIASQAAAGEEPRAAAGDQAGEGKDKAEPKQGDPGGGGRPRQSRRRAVRQAWRMPMAKAKAKPQAGAKRLGASVGQEATTGQAGP